MKTLYIFHPWEVTMACVVFKPYYDFTTKIKDKTKMNNNF